eukprot:7752389-Karenia_brevis.AAC.1
MALSAFNASVAAGGVVERFGDGFLRAHLQRRADDGRKDHIHGPRRGEKRKAEEDLEAIHAAACGPDAWSGMAAEARRLHERADFEARVAACVAGRAMVRDSSLPSPSAESQSLENMHSYDSQEYYNDANEIWQEIDDDGILPSTYKHPPPISVTDPKDPIEATALLSQFRPARMSTQDLEKLLHARADPNIILSGDMHPLFKVMTFANADCVGPMRALLLGAGAVESQTAKERWALRCRSDSCEEAWMRNFHRDPR